MSTTRGPTFKFHVMWMEDSCTTSSEDNPLKITKTSAHYIKQYDKLCLGHLPANTSFYHMVDICFSFHQVVSVIEPWGVPACSMNPAQFDCPTCKGFKSYGICSHVLAINHILEQIDVACWPPAQSTAPEDQEGWEQEADTPSHGPTGGPAPCRHPHSRTGMISDGTTLLAMEYTRILQSCTVFQTFIGCIPSVFYPYSRFFR